MPSNLDPNSAENHDDWSRHWDSYADSARLNPAQEMRHNLAIHQLSAAGDASLLIDFGCGQGDFLERLSACRPALRLVGFELSKTGVEISKRKVPSAEIFEVDLFTPPASIDQFRSRADVAVCLDVIEHVDNPADFLASARNYLKPEGILLLSVPGGPMSAFDRHIGHRSHFTRRKLQETVTLAGFRVEKIWLAGFPFFNLYRLLIILMGKRLIAHAASGRSGESSTMSGSAEIAMKVFRFLFRFNLSDTPFGWQVFAVARNPAN